MDDLCGSGVIDSPISPSVSGGVPRGHTPEVLQRATEFFRHVAMLGRVGGIPYVFPIESDLLFIVQNSRYLRCFMVKHVFEKELIVSRRDSTTL